MLELLTDEEEPSNWFIDFRGIDREAGIALYKKLATFAAENADRIATYAQRWFPSDDGRFRDARRTRGGARLRSGGARA